MASDVRVRVFDPSRQTVVIEAWLGGNVTRDRARAVLQRPPDCEVHGWESWGSVGSAEVLAIAEARYERAPNLDDIRDWLARYPATDCWWIIEHDY